MVSEKKQWIKIDESSIYQPQDSEDETKWPDIRFISYRLPKLDKFFGGNRFPNLTVLLCVEIGLSEINSLSTLSNCPNLYLINCSHNKITSLQGIETLLSIKFFYCNDNQITDLAPLSCLINLTSLECQNNQLHDLHGLEFCPNLQTIKCGQNPMITQAIAQGTLERTIQELKQQLPTSTILIEGF